MSKNKP